MKNLYFFLALLTIIPFSNSLPHFIYDGIESYHQCIEEIDKITFTIYGSLSEEINPKTMRIPNYLIEDFCEFQCSLLKNEETDDLKRTHKIECHIIGSFPIKGYIIDEPKVIGFDFNDEKGETTWPEEYEKKIIIIGECGERKEINNEPILLGSASDFVSPIKNVRKATVDQALKSLPSRTTLTKEKMIDRMVSAKNRFSLSQVETAYMIYKWEAQNIAYDCYTYYHDYSHIDYTVDGTYNKGKGVCAGYSNLFATFAKGLGLEVVTISGYAKGVSYVQGKIPKSTNHAWNAVKIGSSYYLLDVTWGSGSCNGDKYTAKMRDSYFCANPYAFIRTHLPPEHKWQMISPTITIQQFVDMMTLQPEFFDLGFITISPDKVGTINSNRHFTARLTYQSKVELLLNPYYVNNGKKEIDYYACKANYQSKSVEISCSFKQLGKIGFLVFAKVGNSYTHLFTYDINCSNSPS